MTSALRTAAPVAAALWLLGCAGGGGTSGTGTGGRSGNSGTAGTTGTAGAGSGGTSGVAGTSGTSGTAGTSGATGAAGVGGTSGSAGASGTSGSAGAGGTSGSAGTTGAAGRGGGGGATGTAGVTGAAGAGGGSGGRGGAAGGTAGGAGGAAGTGAVGAAGAATNPCAARTGLLFCDDFEKAGTTLATPWTTQFGSPGNVSVDGTTPAHSGTKSVHVYGSGFQTFFTLSKASILPVAGGRLYFRAYMRLGAPMTTNHNTFILGDLAASPGNGNALRIGEQVQMLMYTVMGDAHAALSHQNHYTDGLPGIMFTPGTWVCLEVLADHGGPEIDVWVDGQEVPDLHHTDFAVDAYDSLHFGAEIYDGTTSDIWYDDVAIGTARIGCN